MHPCELGEVLFEDLFFKPGAEEENFVQKRPIFIHTCATCFELPSTTSTMVQGSDADPGSSRWKNTDPLVENTDPDAGHHKQQIYF